MCGSSNEAVAFYRHFQPSDNLPDPSRLLSASLSPAEIMRLWEVCWNKVRATRGSQPDNTASSHSSSR